MIRNIVILSLHGDPLYHQHFGECHNFGSEKVVIDMFFNTVHLLAIQHAEGTFDSGIKIPNSIDLGQEKLIWIRNSPLICAVIAELPDDNITIQKKILKITTMFHDQYGQLLVNYKGDMSLFTRFTQQLLDSQITSRNCGENPECNLCEKHLNQLPISEYNEKAERYLNP